MAGYSQVPGVDDKYNFPPEVRAALTHAFPQFHGIRLTAFGHSFGQVQATPNVWAGALYTTRIRDLLRADTSLFVNRGVNGYTMTQIAAAATANWTDGNGGLVILMGNQNSVGNHEAVATFKTAVRSFLTTIRGASQKPPTVLVIKDVTSTSVGYAKYTTPPTDADVAAYNGYLMDVIAEFPTGWIIVADPMATGWDPATMTAADGQHPNERGMAHIVSAALRALAPAPYRPGQNIGVQTPLVITAAPPTALTLVASPGDAKVTISATGGTGATSYALYRGTTATGTAIATAFPFTDTGRINGTPVTYIATATNANGTVTSSTITVTPSSTAAQPNNDTFNRTDSTTTLGTSDTGQVWAVGTNAVFGISSTAAYRVTAGTTNTPAEDVAVIETAKPNADVKLTIKTIGTTSGCGPVFRYTDLNNYWYIDVLPSGVQMYKKVAGVSTPVGSKLAAAGASGDVWEVIASGSSITAYANGVQAGVTQTDAFNATATKVGIRIAGTAAESGGVRLKNLLVNAV